MTEAELLKKPCEICKERGLWRSGCTTDGRFSCGIYWEILFEQWDATCKLIRERTGKKK